MAEIVTLVLDKLISLIDQEASLLKGVHGEVKSIKDELESIASFLVEADAREARGESNENIRTWVKQVRELAYRIEDVIDEYTHNVARRRQEQGVSKLLHKTGRSIMKLAVRHEIASEIEDIKKDVLEIKSRTDRYGLIASTQQGSMQQVTNTSPIASLFVAEAELVGIEGPTEVLKGWLSEAGKGERMVISVVGMGGLGKTTLVRKVYDSHIVQFNCYAWITVSQSFSTKELLKNIIRQFYQAQKESAPASIETMDEIEQLVMVLRNYVETKRYVVVFDDVWSTEFRENMVHAFSENKKCSRILFTTRSEDVAPSTAQSSLNRVYKLPLLPFEKAFQLFCKKVFQSLNGGVCPPELDEVSREIVKKCDGLPLAIVAVGGILSRKEKNASEWKIFQNSLISKLQSDEQMTRVNKILSLSIHDLSPQLKSCLFYFGIYPEDCSITCLRLIRQWIAEGFVQAKYNEVLEDVAKEYLFELIRRSVIQVSHVDESGRVRECRVHDLMREVILLKSKDMRFYSIYGENVDGRPRRLSLMGKNDVNMSVVPGNTNVSLVRSIFVFHQSIFSENFTRDLLGNTKLLKMLDLEGSRVKKLPKSVGDLFHLNYLSVRNTEVETLPKSIGKLVHLETLDMKKSRVHELPVEIKRLLKLRHLLGYSRDGTLLSDSLGNRRGVKIDGGLGCWETLQKLCYVKADSATIKELIKFTKLRRLGIASVRSEDVTQLCKAIENMKELRSLEIKLMDREQVMDLESIDSPPPPLLQRLTLIGGLKALPRWITKLQNLVRLTLSLSGLANDPLGSLQNLPNLLVLSITDDACKAEKLHFKRGGFPKLKALALYDLKVVKELMIEQGALPCLEDMHIGPFSPEMMEVPSGIQHLTNLKFLVFKDFSEEFYMKMVPGGPSRSIIQHIPRVLFGFRDSTGECEISTPASYKNRKVNN